MECPPMGKSLNKQTIGNDLSSITGQQRDSFCWPIVQRRGDPGDVGGGCDERVQRGSPGQELRDGGCKSV